jgi:squalene-hopene/tetraprenyl-beta-curcumene cyclase
MADAVGVGFQRELDPESGGGERQFAAKLGRAVSRATQFLLSLQEAEGYWCGELEADTTLESDYIFYLHMIGRAEPGRVQRLANYVRRRQSPEGDWNIYPGGPGELNATVKAYVALRLAGDSAEAPHMALAGARVRELGGLEATNSFTRFYLAMGGAIGWDMVPAIAPELMLLPRWSPINLYEASSWTRGIVVPLMILWARKPAWSLPVDLEVEKLFRDPSRRLAAFAWSKKIFTWRNFFLAIDRGMKWRERLPVKFLRRRALAAAERWMLEHLERSEGLAAIYPAMMNSIFALVAMGFPPDHPRTSREIDEFARLEIAEEDTIRLQPCFSPVWDTGIAMVSLEEAGVPPDDPALVRAADWLLDRQVLKPGDWQVKAKGVEPGGWVFEYSNDFYPDVDDTAFVLMALRRVVHPNPQRLESAIRRGAVWLLGMQNRNGGWGAFDKDNDRQILTEIPFSDHNAMLDPATPDVTARVVECLAQLGLPSTHPAIRRAYRFLCEDQTDEGAWYGRWGVNYVYGTSGVLRSLDAAGLAGEDACRRALEWLHSIQNPDGGFGESIASYDDPSRKGKGESTPSQTAWGLIGLLAAAGPNDEGARRAAEYLLAAQNPDGSWDEETFTGTGFPLVFYLRYHLYRNSFPLYALARYRNQIDGSRRAGGVRLSPNQLKRNGA